MPTLVGEGGVVPTYASAGAAGADLRASEDVEIPPGGRVAVPTILRLQLPPDHVVAEILSTLQDLALDPAVASGEEETPEDQPGDSLLAVEEESEDEPAAVPHPPT